jgi:hypothetical protein
VKYVTVLGEKRTKVTNTPIKWKEGKELILNENSPSDFSFFNWFSEPEKKGRMNEIHDKIADIIKDDLLLNPLDYFNNEDSDEAYEDDDENVSSDVEMDDDDSYDAEMDSDDSDDDDDDDEEYDDEDYDEAYEDDDDVSSDVEMDDDDDSYDAEMDSDDSDDDDEEYDNEEEK